MLGSNRLTLASAFRRAGWQTVGDIPSDPGPWPEGQAFYRYQRMLDASNVGYVGPRYSYARVPDQYTLAAFDRLVLAREHRRPVMAEIDLDSSHNPWSVIPRLVPWDQIGDGSVFWRNKTPHSSTLQILQRPPPPAGQLRALDPLLAVRPWSRSCGTPTTPTW